MSAEWIDALQPRVVLLFGFALGAFAALVGHMCGLAIAKIALTFETMRESERPSSLPRPRA